MRKGGERFELLKADAEMQLEEANSRLAEVRFIQGDFFHRKVNIG